VDLARPDIDEAQHGRITPKYVDYNREDVWGTVELYLKAMEEISCIVGSGGKKDWANRQPKWNLVRAGDSLNKDEEPHIR